MDTQDILKYLSGELSAEDKTSFEARLKNDQQLAKEVAAVRQMKSYASTKADETKAILASKKIHQAYKSKELGDSKNNSIIKYLIPLAVAAMVVLGIFIRQDSNTNQLSNPELYASYFTPTELPLVNRSADNQSLEENAQTSFNNKDYLNAEKHLSELIQLKGESDILNLYRAISLLQLDRVTEAESLLLSLLQNPAYRTESLYFLGLTKIKQLKNEEAVGFLEQIAEGSSRYGEAQAIIENIRG